MITLYKNQSGKIGTWSISIQDDASLKISHARSEGAKEVTRIIPVVGKNIGRANETTPLEQAELERDSRVRKQLDKGYVKTVEEAQAPATNSLGFTKPQLAMVYAKVKDINWDHAYAQPKADGHRCMYKDGQLYSRGGKPIELPHILTAIETAGLASLHLDGELYLHGTSLQGIGSLVKRPREESEALEYWIYDVVSDRSFKDRFWEAPFESRGKLRIMPTVQVWSEDELREWNQKWVSEGWEGSILRWGTEGYQSDKRSKYLLKMKEYQDSEARVVGWKLGTPRIAVEIEEVEDGAIGTSREFQVVVFELENNWGGNTFEVTAPGNMHEVHVQAQNADSYIGRQLQFKYFTLSDDSVPLQPIALGWRDDV